MTGVIIKGIGGFYYIKTGDGEVVECRAKGIFRKDHIKPMIGDRVEIEEGSLARIWPRRNFLVRPPVSNIDHLVIVAAAASPQPDFMLIDKMLVNAERADIFPIICINKTDLASYEELRHIYSLAGYPVVTACAKEGAGLDELMPYLQGKTTAFAGLSGVGKSSILNILTGQEIETGHISDKIQRGKHTTRHVELIELKNGGLVLDTPGFSSLEVDRMHAEDLWQFFPEFKVEGCRFKGCSHVHEPDCAVKNKLQQGQIAQTRYASYCKLYSTLKEIKDWEK